MNKKADKKAIQTAKDTKTPLITRSEVPSNLKFHDYKRYLRRDFYWSCAYCTIAESEATSIRFTIDHYEPQTSRPDLKDAYSNLMYSCDTCNMYKSDRVPSKKAAEAGVRFFRPDQDHRSEHFKLDGPNVKAKTPVADFTVIALSLNRQPLRRLRELRAKITNSSLRIEEGILALRRSKLDLLSRDARGSAASAIARAVTLAQSLKEDFEETLLSQARSPLHGDDDAEQASEDARNRLAEMKEFEALWPGSWRGRSK